MLNANLTRHLGSSSPRDPTCTIGTDPSTHAHARCQMIALLWENAAEVEGLLLQSRALGPGSGPARDQCVGEDDHDHDGSGREEEGDAES